MRIPYSCALILALVGCSPPTSAYDDPWFNPPGGTWVPDARVVARMKVALDDDLRPAFEGSVNSGVPPARYWFQYVGTGSGADQAIGIVGYPFPVPLAAKDTFLGAIVPEACHVFATYLPKQRRIKDSGVGGFYCPPRI
jgi:hypothetical protein